MGGGDGQPRATVARYHILHYITFTKYAIYDNNEEKTSSEEEKDEQNFSKDPRNMDIRANALPLSLEDLKKVIEEVVKNMGKKE